MGRKDFNKGMEAGARPFEEKFRRMGKEFKDFSGRMEEDVDNIKRTNEAILDEMDSMQKKQFYRDNTAVDITVLEKGDRETLLSILFTLAETEENVNKYQQLFIRSVRKYLENEEDGRKPKNWSVLKGGNWSIIETIIGIEETKAIAQAVMEFLFLGYGNHEEYFEEYEDLFECFCLNRKGFGEIRAHIDNIYRATGLEGIAENYGYVPEKDMEGKAVGHDGELYGAKGELEELNITEEIRLANGEEITFENKKIIFEKGIKSAEPGRASDNKIVFKNCEIIVQEEKLDNKEVISGLEKGAVIFKDCTVTNGKCVLVCCWSMKLVIEGSYLNVGAQIYNGEEYNGKGTASIKHCYINLLRDGENIFFCSKFEMSDTSVYGNKEKGRINSFHLSSSMHSLFESKEGYVHIEGCHFYNLPELVIQGGVGSEVIHSSFKDCCVKITGSHNSYGVFINCEFQNCIFAEAYGGMNFEDTKLLSCIGILPAKYMKDMILDDGFLVIWGVEDMELVRCRFLNWSVKTCENIVDKNGNTPFSYSHLTFGKREQEVVMEVYGWSKITSCQFVNLDLGEKYLIGGGHVDSCLFTVKNCHFENIQTGSKEIFRKEFHYKEGGLFRDKERIDIANVEIEGCTGL